MSARPVLEAMLARRSRSRVSEISPTHAELIPLVAAASRVADHSSLHPWRLLEIRGDARDTVGRSFAKALGKKDEADRYITKTRRAPLLIAVIVSVAKSKVPAWEQEAVASGVAHALSLLLDEAGWGVFWRTGEYTRAKAVRKAHRLDKNEELLGWLYVGGRLGKTDGPKKPVDARRHLSAL